MRERVGMPNGKYYGNAVEHSFWEKGCNPALAEFGASMRAPCGGLWVLGRDFAFDIHYAATGYDHMATVYEYGNSITEKWRELRHHLLEYEHTWHTLKDRVSAAADIGVATAHHTRPLPSAVIEL